MVENGDLMNTAISSTRAKSEPYWRIVRKSLEFDGGTSGAVGNSGGASDPANVFTITGDVIVKIIAICTETLTGGSATIELGIGGGLEIIATTTATLLIVREIWHDNSPDAEIEALSVRNEFIITDGNDIQLDVDVANVTDGTILFVCEWTPLSTDGNVVAA